MIATARNVADIEELDEAGCTTLELDVTDHDQVLDVVERTVEIGGAIDCLVNNAGYAQMGPIEDVPMADLHRQFDVNVYGPTDSLGRRFRTCAPRVRADRQRLECHRTRFVSGSGAYSGSKHALEAMSDSLRAEVEEFGIDVVVIEPGPVETNFGPGRRRTPEAGRTPAYESLYELYDDMQLIGGEAAVRSPPSRRTSQQRSSRPAPTPNRRRDTPSARSASSASTPDISRTACAMPDTRCSAS